MKSNSNSNSVVDFKIYGGADAVTGSNFMLSFDSNYRLLIDCGLTQGSDGLEARNWQEFAYDPARVNDLIITHAHMDHIGLIGKLVAEGFTGTIHSTTATKDLARVMLEDGLRIVQYNAKRREVEPLWTEDDLNNAFSNWQTYEYHELISLHDGLVTVEFSDAGHILGSAMARISYRNKSITFTGDLGNSPSPLLRDTEPVTNSDMLVMEAVYGNRNHQNRDDRIGQLQDVVQRGIDRGGAIIIPAFSLERTQMLLYELNELVEAGRLPEIPVFLDSPLAIKVLDIYEQHTSYFNDAAKNDIKSGDDIFRFPGLQITKSKEDSKAIKHVPGPKIIIAGSGMSHAGRVLFHELEYLDEPETTLFFVGYQGPGTVGRQLLEGNKYVRIMGRKIQARAAIESLLSYSSHKDMQHLHELAVGASKNGTNQIYVVLSEPKVAVSFSQQLIEDPAIEAKVITPELGQEFKLDFS